MGYIMGFWYCVFFFKQKTAYELRISDWSSDVCSSDLDMVLDIGVEIFAADALDDIARERGRIIGIGRRRAGREDAFGQRERHLLLERHHRLRIAADQVAYRFLETRGMRHDVAHRDRLALIGRRSEEHTSELQSLMRISYAVFCLKKKKQITKTTSLVTSS